MRCHWIIALALLVFSSAESLAFEVNAVIKKVDLDHRVVLVTAKGQERSISLPDVVKVFDAQGQSLADGLKSKELAAGAEVILSVERQGNRPVLQAIRIGGQPGSKPARTSSDTSAVASEEVKQQDTSKLVPLVDLGQGKYQGFEGGLYPGGKNVRPPEHESAGLSLAAQVQPVDAAGKPDARGKIVLLGIGFSNTVQAFNGFMQVAAEDASINPHLVLVNGAVGGMSAARIQNPDDQGSGTQYWRTVDERLAASRVTREQVQVVWIKETDPQPHEGSFPAYVQTLQSELKKIVRILPKRFANLRLCYFSSRTYGGWARARAGRSQPGNSEPFSYESGFAYKWLIEEQLRGDPELAYSLTGSSSSKAPWLSWSAYLWTNGPKPRSDGVYFELADFNEVDRMHESPAGQRKVGGLLLNFFKTDSTTKTWFVGR